MQTGLRWIATACLIGATALAQNGAASKPASRPTPTTPAEKLAAIEAEYSDAMKAFQEAYKNAKTEEDKDKVFEEKYPKAEVWFPRLIEIAKGGADDKVAVGALVWVVSHGATSGEAKEAVGLLAEKHLTSPELKKVFGPLARSTSKANEDLIRRALASSPHEEVKAQASYSLAQMVKYRGELAAMLAEPLNEEMRKSLEKRFDADERAALAAVDTKAAGKEVEELLENAKEMATGKPWGEKLAETIAGDLYEIRNLAIGMVAPEIEAEDLNGKPMKLTDFRGKVVVLDFWGNW